jgi:hypothetical protein
MILVNNKSYVTSFGDSGVSSLLDRNCQLKDFRYSDEIYVTCGIGLYIGPTRDWGTGVHAGLTCKWGISLYIGET